MARIRTVKPELAAHEGMFDAERETGLPLRFAWVMMFTACDREGRFAWRPRTLKVHVLPHDEVDFSRVLDAWGTRGFIRKYRVGNEWFGCIPSFTRHQAVNNREAASEIPPIEEANEEYQWVDAIKIPEPRDGDACLTREVHAQAEGKEGKEGESTRSFVLDASSSRRSRINGAHEIGDWSPGQDFEQWAERNGFPPEVRFRAFQEMKAWALSKGARKKDWPATLKGWLLRDRKAGHA